MIHPRKPTNGTPKTWMLKLRGLKKNPHPSHMTVTNHVRRLRNGSVHEDRQGKVRWRTFQVHVFLEQKNSPGKPTSDVNTPMKGFRFMGKMVESRDVMGDYPTKRMSKHTKFIDKRKYRMLLLYVCFCTVFTGFVAFLLTHVDFPSSAFIHSLNTMFLVQRLQPFWIGKQVIPCHSNFKVVFYDMENKQKRSLRTHVVFSWDVFNKRCFYIHIYIPIIIKHIYIILCIYIHIHK